MAKAGSQRQGNLAFKGNTVVRMIFNKNQHLKPNRNRDFNKGGHSFDSAVLFFPACRQAGLLSFAQAKERREVKRGSMGSESRK